MRQGIGMQAGPAKKKKQIWTSNQVLEAEAGEMHKRTQQVSENTILVKQSNITDYGDTNSKC